MSERMRRILESKRAMRRKLSALPFADKVKLLEQLRERSLLIASSPLKRRGAAINKETGR
jgi:hypothetical protein